MHQCICKYFNLFVFIAGPYVMLHIYRSEIWRGPGYYTDKLCCGKNLQHEEFPVIVHLNFWDIESVLTWKYIYVIASFQLEKKYKIWIEHETHLRIKEMYYTIYENTKKEHFKFFIVTAPIKLVQDGLSEILLRTDSRFA